MPTSRASVQNFGQVLAALIQQLNQEQQNKQYQREVMGARQGATQNIPVNIPGAAFGNPLAPMQDVQTQGQSFDQARYIQNLLPLLGMNPLAQTQLQATMALQPKYQFINQEGGGLQQATIPPFGEPTVKTITESKPMTSMTPPAPTELAKYQDELMRIRTANPKDPRIPEYEAVIKKLQIGVPGFQVRPDSEGRYRTFNSKTGKWEDSAGPYLPTPSQIKLAASQLQNVRQSAQKIKELVGRASVTGPVTGRARKLGSRFFSDKDAQTLISTIGQLRPIIYGLSGKQINEAEQEWLTNEILPNLAQPDENFDTTLEIFLNWVDQTLGNMKTQFPSLNVPGESGQSTTTLSSEDQQAIEWARANPNDPRAKEILKLHGQQ